MSTHRELFRREALEHYRQGSVTTVYPRFFSFRVVLVCWVLFFLFIGLALSAWSWNVAQFARESGIIQSVLTKPYTVRVPVIPGSRDQALAMLFLPNQFRERVQVGTSVLMQIQGVSKPTRGTIEGFEPTVFDAKEASQHYHTSTQLAARIVYPVMVVFILMHLVTIAVTPDGSRVDVYIQTGTLNLFSIL